MNRCFHHWLCLGSLAWGWALAASGADTPPQKVLSDFGQEPPPANWQVVNDDVMGGVSRSQFAVTNGVGLFTGVVSLENNGGFASVRTRPGRQDCARYDGVLVRLRGDGQSYTFNLRMDDRFDGVLYQAGFKTQPNQWQEHWLPFRDFKPTYHGRILTDAAPLDPARITSLGFLIADKQAGPFRLEIAWIKAASKSSAPAPSEPGEDR